MAQNDLEARHLDTLDRDLGRFSALENATAYVARPQGNGRHATIIVCNEIFGIHEYIKDICRRLAKLGYVGGARFFLPRRR